MRTLLLVSVAAGCGAIATGIGNGAIVGLVVADETATNGGGGPPPGSPRTIYHIYALFDDPADRVNAWGGGGSFGLGRIENVLPNGSLGSGFTNIGAASEGNVPPYSPGTSRDWDTYMTIGVRYGNEAPGSIVLPTGDPLPFIEGPVWLAPDSGAGLAITPDDAQGRADYRIIDSDTQFTVLLMQLVVNQGEHMRGTIGVNWSGGDGIAGAVTSTGLTFTSVPAPAAGALLAGVLVAAARRRRDDA
jgi:hypothetical protein